MLISKNNRHQVYFSSLDMSISEDNEVRLIDAYVDNLDLQALGFVMSGQAAEGRPAFEIGLFLKLYVYGYLNRVRSSRRLERECLVNTEVKWLMCDLHPNYHTIADFRKLNPTALKNTFKGFVRFCMDLNLIGGETIAIDSAKYRGQNSKKNNHSDKAIDDHLDYIEKRTAEYMDLLEEADKVEAEAEKKENGGKREWIDKTKIKEKLEHYAQSKERYEALKVKLAESGDTQISTTDPDARAIVSGTGMSEIGYSVQMAGDDKHNLIVHIELTNTHDQAALSGVAIGAQEVLQPVLTEGVPLDVLADKGYCTGEQIHKTEQAGMMPFVAIPENVQPEVADGFRKQDFKYNPEQDNYTCPNGKTLERKNKEDWQYIKKNRGKVAKRFNRYALPRAVCAACPFAAQCAASSLNPKGHGKQIERSEYDEAMENNKERMRTQYHKYHRRQAIIEHPSGTIKRQWGYTYTLLKGMEKVGGEFALIFLCYNLRRLISILGIDALKKHLKKACAPFFELFISFKSRFMPKLYFCQFRLSPILYLPQLK
jgi:transposase